MQFAAYEMSPGTQRPLATALEFMQKSALCGDAGARFGVVQSDDQSLGRRVVRAGFDSKRALTDRRQHYIRIHDLRDSGSRTETVHAGNGQDNRVELAGIEFFQARIHVPAQIDSFKIGAIVAKLGLPAQTARADAGAGRKSFQAATAARNQAIARVFAPRDGPKSKARGNLRGDILHAVDREINPVFKQGVFEFLDEDSLPSRFRANLLVDLRDRRRLHAIARSAYANDLGLNAVQFGEAIGNMVRLPERECATARSDPQPAHSPLPPFPPLSVSRSIPNRWRRASIAPRRPRISRALRRRSAGSSRTRSISSSVMLERRSRSCGERLF